MHSFILLTHLLFYCQKQQHRQQQQQRQHTTMSRGAGAGGAAVAPVPGVRKHRDEYNNQNTSSTSNNSNSNNASPGRPHHTSTSPLVSPPHSHSARTIDDDEESRSHDDAKRFRQAVAILLVCIVSFVMQTVTFLIIMWFSCSFFVFGGNRQSFNSTLA